MLAQQNSDKEMTVIPVDTNYQSNDNSESKTDEPAYIPPEPTPINPMITFLKGLVAQYPNGSINQCTYQGGTYFLMNPHVGMADADSAVFTDGGVKVGSCGGFHPSPPVAGSPEALCHLITQTCTQRVYYPEGSCVSSPYYQCPEAVDIYNLN